MLSVQKDSVAEGSFRFFNARESGSKCNSAENRCGSCEEIYGSFGFGELSWVDKVTDETTSGCNSGDRSLFSRLRSNEGSDYELSMRDLMELPSSGNSVVCRQVSGGRLSLDARPGWAQKGKMNNIAGKVHARSQSIDNGALLLKIFFPASLLRRNKSCSNSISASSQKVMPQPQLLMESGFGFRKNMDDGVLKKTEVNNDTASKSRKGVGCYSFFNMKRRKDETTV